MLLSPIPNVPSDKSESPKFEFRSSKPQINTTRLGINAGFWMCGLFVALYTALSTPGFWGQGIGKMRLSHLFCETRQEIQSLTLLGCLLVVVHGPLLAG